MNDYIKRDDAIGYIKHVYHESVKFYEVDEEEVIDSLVEALNALPSADVVEVRHSVWRVRLADPDKEYECMKCKKAVGWKYLYCPNCGARMDGEEE